MEFGSDFHTIDFPTGESLMELLPKANLYASGRQALLHLALSRGWQRLWVPSYFCEETLECIPRAGIKLTLYSINPLDDPGKIINSLPTELNDGILVVNYFGLRDLRKFHVKKGEIVEDHTHNLIGNWALNSGADWCIASLRKTLPIADGGILWSPQHHSLPEQPQSSPLTEDVMKKRFSAMAMKAEYLKGGDIAKDAFLKQFRETEDAVDHLPISDISVGSREVVENLDIITWYEAKHRNWNLLREMLADCKNVTLLKPENQKEYPFSFTLLFPDFETRNKVRSELISKGVYPAILWSIEKEGDDEAKAFGDRMLSIHCDGRYSADNMEALAQIIKSSL